MKYIETGKIAKLPKKKIDDEEMKAAKLWTGATDDELPTPAEMLESLRMPAEFRANPNEYSAARRALETTERSRRDRFDGTAHEEEPEITDNEEHIQRTAPGALYNNWRMAYEHGINRNINCGSLRRIGKTHTLRRIMSEFRAQDAVRRIILIVPTMNYRAAYEELYHDGTINLIISNQNQLRGQANAYLFADEVPVIEQLNPNSGVEFIAGFYSR
jgi:hypothetical protein